ncbi:MAG: transcriptional regulator [Anaerolineaceae bacterium 4572_78]|nr:MAG: transcriptional regulator [Anaerolineaceae bacterium 4572_78]
MPTISRFFGIDIRIYYKYHPPPHFHAEYQGQRGTFDFNGNMLKGNIRSRVAKRIVREWEILHREELEENWHNARHDIPVFRIPPLD